MFNKEKLLQPNTAIHCETEDQFQNFVKWAREENLISSTDNFALIEKWFSDGFRIFKIERRSFYGCCSDLEAENVKWNVFDYEKLLQPQPVKHEPHPIFDNTKILGENDVVKVETIEQLQSVINWLNSELGRSWACPKYAFESGCRYFNIYLKNDVPWCNFWREEQEFNNVESLLKIVNYEDLLLKPTTQPSEQENTIDRKPIEDLQPKDTSQDIYFAKKEDKGKLRYDLIEDLPDIECVLPFENVTPSNLDNQTLNSVISDCIFILGSRQNFLKELAKVYTYGCEKYSERSWKTVENGKDRYIASLFRNIDAYQNGQWSNWEDKNCLHVAQIAWNAIAVKWFISNKGD